MQAQGVVAQVPGTMRLSDHTGPVLPHTSSQIENGGEAVASTIEEAVVRAIFRTLLFREPNPQGLTNIMRALKQGASFDDILSGCLRSREFADKIQRIINEYVNVEPTRIDPWLIRAPIDLALSTLDVSRVLIVGSCLSELWASRLATASPPCEADVYLLGNELPAEPARPVSEYQFQLVQVPLRQVLPDASFARLDQADLAAHEKLFAHAMSRMQWYPETAMRWNREHGLLTFVFPFIVPSQNPVGRLMTRYDIRNPVYFVEKLNEELAHALKGFSNSYLFDLNEIFAGYGRNHIQEDVILALNHNDLLSDWDFPHDQGRLEPASPDNSSGCVRGLADATQAVRQAGREMTNPIGQDRGSRRHRQFFNHRQGGAGSEPGDDAALRLIEPGPPGVIVIAQVEDIGGAGLEPSGINAMRLVQKNSTGQPWAKPGHGGFC